MLSANSSNKMGCHACQATNKEANLFGRPPGLLHQLDRHKGPNVCPCVSKLPKPAKMDGSLVGIDINDTQCTLICVFI